MMGQREQETMSSGSSVVSVGEYAPSPNTCSQALTRANQLRVQTLLRQLLLAKDPHRLELVRVLRKTLHELNYQITWLIQVDLYESLERIIREEHEVDTEWTLINDTIQLLIEAIPRLPFGADPQSVCDIFSSVVPNLGHPRSEVRRSSLLLINMYINERPIHFRQILKLFIEHGLANQWDPEAQRGAILSLPLLMTEQAVEGENLLPLVRCLSDLLVNANSELFYSLYLALQRLHLTVGDYQFSEYLNKCSPEAILLYKQAASRNNSLINPHQSSEPASEESEGAHRTASNRRDKSADTLQTQRQVTFESQSDHRLQYSSDSAKTLDGSLIESVLDESDQQEARSSKEQKDNRQLSDRASVSSTCSSEAKLVDPSHYMNAAALRGRPLSNYDQIHHVEHSNTGLAINDLGVCCTPTIELGPGGSQNELKFGIFPRHLVSAALTARLHSDRIEALEEMMCIIRDSPINHLAILMTYFDTFLEQFLARLLDTNADYKAELIAIDMIETIVVKTKVSTMQYVRPMIGLLMRAMADPRSIFHESTSRVIHKMMAYLPPQHVIDAIFEHKHNKNAQVREKSVNRVTAAVLEYGRNEFNLTKLCYHVLPMLADHHANVRLASLECIATLASALGPERIGSLLTAAEAVQTGCDYDGLLDAIHARLMRRTLPRSNSDGSIKYVIKPLLKLAHREDQIAADLRWVLEAPSSHQHVGHHHSDPVKPDSSPAEHSSQHQHRPGVYSPKEGQRRSSVGLLVGLAAVEGEHAHHHRKPNTSLSQAPQCSAPTRSAHYQHQDQKLETSQLHRGSNCTPGSLDTDQRELAHLQDKANGPRGQTDHRPEGSSRESHISDQQEKLDWSEGASGRSTVEEPEKARNTEPNRRHSVKEINGHRLGARRSNSQDSHSSTDTNKVLFQYYLSKFKQSLMDSGNRSTHPVLPSDSIIYTDSAQAYALSRHQSRYQQTSFDYEAGSEGSLPVSDQTQLKEQQQVDTSSSESPLTILEAPSSKCVENSDQQLSRRASITENAQPENLSLRFSRHQSRERLVKANSEDKMNHNGHSRRDSMTGVQALNENTSSRRRSSTRWETQPESDMKQKASISSHSSVDSSKKKSNEAGSKQPKYKRNLVRQSASEAAQVTNSSVSSSIKLENEGDAVSRDSSLKARTESTVSENSLQFNQSEIVDRDAQTAPLLERTNSRGRNRRRSSHQRYPSESGYRNREEQDKEEDFEQLQHKEIRKRSSRSQPPQSRRRTPNKLTREQGADNDTRQAVSVSPSLASSVNIRSILENVAQVEGSFQEPQLAFKVAMDALESPCWSTKVEGILALIRLATFHQPVVMGHLHEIVMRLANETRNLRSTVSRSAIFALGDLCAKLEHSIEPELDQIVQALLHKSIENTAFIRDDIKRSLTTMVDHITRWRLANMLIHHGANHKNMHVRRMASQFVAMLVERMGAAKCLVGARDIGAQLIPAAAKFAQDCSPHTRYHGRVILNNIMQHSAFERLLRKHLAPNLFRSTIGVIESVKRRGAGEPPAES